MSEKTRKSGRGKRLTDDEKIAIAEMVEKGIPVCDIMKKTGCTRPTVVKYAKLFGVDIKSSKQKTVEKEEPKNVEIDEVPSIAELMSQFVKVDSDVILTVGLCDGRHEMNVNKFIFDNVTSQTMFNYDEQLRICLDFIDNNINFVDRKATKRLIVYTTGLNCLNASIIKACYIRNVNLILKHYNNSTNLYNSQTMFDDFEVGYYKNIDAYHVQRMVKNVPLYIEKGVDDIFNEKEMYLIEYTVDNKKSIFITESSKLAWKVFQQISMCKDMVVGKLSVFLDLCKFESKITRKNIAKSFNFKMEK